MKIVRYIDTAGATGWGALHDSDRVTRLEGNWSQELLDTGETVTVKELLAPLRSRSGAMTVTRPSGSSASAMAANPAAR